MEIQDKKHNNRSTNFHTKHNGKTQEKLKNSPILDKVQ